MELRDIVGLIMLRVSYRASVTRLTRFNNFEMVMDGVNKGVGSENDS